MGQRKNPFDPDVNVRILLILGASPDPAHLVSSLEASSSPAFAQVRSQTVWETNALHLADAVKKKLFFKKKNPSIAKLNATEKRGKYITLSPKSLNGTALFQLSIKRVSN